MTMAITISTTFYENFWANTLEPYDSDCWEWQGPFVDDGTFVDDRYGLVSIRALGGYGARSRVGLSGSSGALAHRVAWELARGPLAEGAWVLHHCDNPPCVRPSHLFLGDALANAQDRDRKGRAWWAPNAPARHLRRVAS